MFPDVELLLTGFLRANLQGVWEGTETPADLAAQAPAVQVAILGGADTDPGVDTCRVDVDCYAVGRQAASDLARQVRSLLRFTLPGYAGPGGVVSKVVTGSAPSWQPYDNTTLRRFGAEYGITVHSTT